MYRRVGIVYHIYGISISKVLVFVDGEEWLSTSVSEAWVWPL